MLTWKEGKTIQVIQLAKVQAILRCCLIINHVHPRDKIITHRPLRDADITFATEEGLKFYQL